METTSQRRGVYAYLVICFSLAGLAAAALVFFLARGILDPRTVLLALILATCTYLYWTSRTSLPTWRVYALFLVVVIAATLGVVGSGATIRAPIVVLLYIVTICCALLVERRHGLTMVSLLTVAIGVIFYSEVGVDGREFMEVPLEIYAVGHALFLLVLSGIVIAYDREHRLHVWTEAELAKQRTVLSNIFAHLHEAVVLTDNELRIQESNRAAETYFGLSEDELNDMDFRALLDDSDIDILQMRTEAAIARRLFRRKDGSTFVGDYSLGRITSPAAEHTAIVFCIRDVTEQEEQQQQLLETQAALVRSAEELERHNHDLSQFAYIAAHDLMEPARTVSSFSQVLNDKYAHQLDETGNHSLRFISESANRMQNLIDGLLQYVRLGSKRVVGPVDMNQVVISVRQDLHDVITDTQASVTAGAMPTLHGSEVELRMMMQNLVSNAIKFCESGNTPQVEISATQLEGHVEIAVKDNGIGIAPDKQDRIFNLFERLHREKDYEGVGIGLAHCSKIVNLHHGEIRVDSEPGQGSTFVVSMPVTPP